MGSVIHAIIVTNDNQVGKGLITPWRLMLSKPPLIELIFVYDFIPLIVPLVSLFVILCIFFFRVCVCVCV